MIYIVKPAFTRRGVRAYREAFRENSAKIFDAGSRKMRRDAPCSLDLCGSINLGYCAIERVCVFA